MKKFLIPIGIFALLGYLLYYGLRLDPRKIPSPLVNKPLPAFSLPSLDQPDKFLTNADLRERTRRHSLDRGDRARTGRTHRTRRRQLKRPARGPRSARIRPTVIYARSIT